MRLYTLNKAQFAVVFAIFFLSYAVALIIGLIGPPITTTRSHKASDLPEINSTDLWRGPFRISSPLVSPYCHQLWLFAQFLTDSSNEGAEYQWKFLSRAKVQGRKASTGDLEAITTFNVSNNLHCNGAKCEDVIIAHQWYLSYPQYVLDINFEGLQNFDQKFHMANIVFYWRSYNPAFVQLEIWFRFIFMILAFGVTIWFFHTLKSYSMRHWALEQKWISLLLPLLLLYNNPLFPMVFLVSSWLPSVLDSLFQATYLSALLLFWLCIYHGIRQNSRKFAYFYLPKLILVGSIWICAIVLSAWDRYQQAAGPQYHVSSADTGNFEGFKIVFYILGGLYVLYLGFLLVRAYSELKNLPYFDVRLKFFTFLMVLVIGVTVLMTIRKFGINPVLQDSFIAHLNADFTTSVEFMALYGLMNLYMFTMAYVYSPNPNLATSAATEFQFKDVPTMSLLNDSEDEISLYNPEKPKSLFGGNGDSDDD